MSSLNVKILLGTVFFVSWMDFGYCQESKTHTDLNLDLPLIDMPFSGKKGAFPSMTQSLSISRTYYDLAHIGLESAFDMTPQARGWDGFKSRLGYAFFDFYFLKLFPGGQSWLHEEWHRAVMSNRGIGSHNDVNDFQFGKSLIAVSHETDEDLATLKRDHPEDMVRLGAAGMEAEHALAQNLEADTFFHENPAYRPMLLWSLQTSPIFYLWTCSSGSADKATDHENEGDGTSVKKRDFTGLDCTGWIRDLNRADEPYESRGIHPSGVGINRYTKFADLNSTERDYLTLNRNLSALNLVDPYLFRHESFSMDGIFGENDAKYNVNLHHDLTSFGMSLSATFMYASSLLKSEASLFAYHNHLSWFPGVELKFLEVPLGDSRDWLCSLQAQIWQQPKDFSFHTKSAMTGGLLGTRLAYNKNQFVNPYLHIVGKSKGWVAGAVDQGRSFQTILGIQSKL